MVHFEAHGLADVEAKKAMTTDTLFRLASMTKPVTAVSVLMLMKEGKLVLSDPVSKFVPEFKNPKVAVWSLPNDPAGAGLRLVPAAREITIHDLLTHTSGLANGFEGPAGDYVRRANLPSGGSLDERVQARGDAAAQLPAGHAVGIQPVDRLRHARAHRRDPERDDARAVLQDAHLRAARHEGHVLHGAAESRAPTWRSRTRKTETGLTRPPAPPAAPRADASGPYFSGAGGLTGSTTDYLAFSQMLLNGGQLNGVRLLSRKTVELMTSDAIGQLDLRNYAGDQVLKGYGFGLGVRVRRSTGDNGWMGTVGDYGWAGALGTYFWIDPKEQLIGHRDDPDAEHAAAHGVSESGVPGDRRLIGTFADELGCGGA